MRTEGMKNKGMRQQRGSNIVEFALLLPVLLSVMLTIVNYVGVFMIQQVLTYGAEEAARAGQVYAASSSARDTAVRTRMNTVIQMLPAAMQGYVSSPTVNTNDATCTVSGLSCLTVTVTYPYRNNPLTLMLPGLEGMLPATLTGTASVLYE